MTIKLKPAFEAAFPIQITSQIIQKIHVAEVMYETRGNHAMAFNDYTLGVYSCSFTDKDRDALFECFDGCGVEVTVNTLRKTIKQANGVPAAFKVASDPFNMFIAYITHLIYTSTTLSEQERHIGVHDALMLLQYKFFTSLVNYRFRYKPDENIMRALYERLNNKYDIKFYGTWKRVMETRVQNLIWESDIHKNCLETFADDKAIIYFISDIQTRIRSQINLFTTEFMKAKDENDRIGSYSSTGTDSETGDTVLLDLSSRADTMIENTAMDILSVPKLLNDKMIRLISGLFSALNPALLRTFLIYFSEYAVSMQKQGKQHDIEEDKQTKTKVIIGHHALVQQLVQTSLRYCSSARIQVESPVAVLRCMREAFASSRIIDEGVLLLRASAVRLTTVIDVSKREATLSALRIGFLLYLLMIAWQYNK
jgi:hypothetical protein